MRHERKTNLISGMVVSAATIIVSLFAIEKAAQAYLPDPHAADAGLMFFSEGSVFQNKSWGGFVYQPSIQITSRTLYVADPKILRV
jgi:hypothetical protein